MRRISYIFFIFFSCAALAQNQDTLKTRKIAWGISFSPDYCYRTLDYQNSAQWIEKKRNKEEVARIGFTFGINLSRKIANAFSMDAGLLFSEKGEKTKWEKLNWNRSEASFPAESRVIYRYQYFDVPLKLNYYLSKGKFRFFVSAGVSTNFFIRQTTVLQVREADGDKTANKSYEPGIYSRVNFAGLLSAGMSVDLAKRVSLRLEPIFRRSLSPVLVNVSNKEYLYSLGLNIGIYLRLKNKPA